MKILEESLEEKVLRCIKTCGLLEEGDKVLAAVSGGADSTALLLLMHSLKEKLGIELAAAHFEHGIRGEESISDQRFVEHLCQKLDIRCVCGHGDVPALCRTLGGGMEDAARQARYAFLEDEAEKMGGAKIALAHQMEDQAETLLLHLTHGCGLEGLGGMKMKSGRRIRPLLECSRGEIEEYLREKGQAWREDASNRECVYSRNRLRHEVFPLLRQLNPQVIRAFCRTAQQAQRAAQLMEDQAEKLLQDRVCKAPFGVFWRRPEEESPFFREALRLLCRNAGIPELSMEQTMRLESLEEGEKCNLPGSWRAMRSRRGMYLLSPRPEKNPPVPGSVTETQAQDTLGDGVFFQAFEEKTLAGACLRWPEEGDKFSPMGGEGQQKLTEALRDAGIEAPFRPWAPVLAREDEILWIIGTGKVSRRAKLTEKSQNVRVLRYRGSLPWMEGTKSDTEDLIKKTEDVSDD